MKSDSTKNEYEEKVQREMGQEVKRLGIDWLVSKDQENGQMSLKRRVMFGNRQEIKKRTNKTSWETDLQDQRILAGGQQEWVNPQGDMERGDRTGYSIRVSEIENQRCI